MRLVLDARTAAFGGLIDYAGLFPPASKTMEEAAVDYARLRSEDSRWIVGKFLCRASQLEDLASAAMSQMRRGDQPWEVGVIFDMGPGAAAMVVNDFQTEMSPALSVTSVEAKTPQFDEVPVTSATSGTTLERFRDVSVSISAELGRVSMPLGELLKIGEGAVVKLDRPVSAPVELLAQGVRVALGEVVVVDDCFAVRIREIDSAGGGLG